MPAEGRRSSLACPEESFLITVWIESVIWWPFDCVLLFPIISWLLGGLETVSIGFDCSDLVIIMLLLGSGSFLLEVWPFWGSSSAFDEPGLEFVGLFRSNSNIRGLLEEGSAGFGFGEVIFAGEVEVFWGFLTFGVSFEICCVSGNGRVIWGSFASLWNSSCSISRASNVKGSVRE